MAKYLLRQQARELREKGVSIKQIAKKLNVSKSTSSNWVRDVKLTDELILQLKKQELEGAERGRLKNKLLNEKKRLKIRKDSRDAGILALKDIKMREFLIAGLALYWGEGSKSNKRVEFCNSDPKMIKFLITWLKKAFGIGTESLICIVGINGIHNKREKLVKDYWSQISGVPLEQFRKTNFKRVQNKKVYANFNEHFGTLTVRVSKSTSFYYKLIGLIEGLFYNLPT